MNVEKYGVGESAEWLTNDPEEARQVARERRSYVVAYVFEFAGSEIINDYREPKPAEKPRP